MKQVIKKFWKGWKFLPIIMLVSIIVFTPLFYVYMGGTLLNAFGNAVLLTIIMAVLAILWCKAIRVL